MKSTKEKQIVEEIYNKGYNAFGQELIMKINSNFEIMSYTVAGLTAFIQAMLLVKKEEKNLDFKEER